MCIKDDRNHKQMLTSVEEGTQITLDDVVDSDSQEDFEPDDNLQTRTSLLCALLTLCCAMVKRNHNVNYTFASILPKLFYRTNYDPIPSDFSEDFFPEATTKKSSIVWRVNKERLAHVTLRFCEECLMRSSFTPFHVCGIMIPRLVKNLDRTKLSDQSKMNMLLGMS